jgi:hypothetical protein
MIRLRRKSIFYCPKCSAKVSIEKEWYFTVGDMDFSELTDNSQSSRE